MEIFGDAGANAAVLRRQCLPAGHAGAVRQFRHGEWRGPTAPNLDLSLFRVFRLGQNKTLQVRAEVFNLTNTPHFSNPNTIISNVTFNADGSIARLNGVGGITDRPHRPAV